MFSSVSRLQYPKALGKDRDKNLAGCTSSQQLSSRLQRLQPLC